jgi:peptide/nickel transport system substrate-binding protein
MTHLTWGMRTWLGAAAVVSSIGLAATACGGGSSSNSGSNTQQGRKGGTLTLLAQSDFEHLDPQRVYVSNATNFTRLFTRTLTAYKAAPGKAGTQLVPDLATDLGQSSDSGTTWKFTLKDGLKYEDGSAITSQDIKYGAERSFSDEITDGTQYAKQYLVGGDTYKGPYVGDDNGGKGLESIETPDPKTIVFHLKQPVADFRYTVTWGTFAPVPKAKDTRANYDAHPFSSGPYKIASYDKSRGIDLVRNTYWDAKTDTVRKALPDRISVQFGVDPSTITQRLIADRSADQATATIDTQVAPEYAPQVFNNAGVKARQANGQTVFTWYLGINTRKVSNLAVRQALNYAVNREDYIRQFGGPQFGDPATTITNPTSPSSRKFDLYPAGRTGNPAKAKEALRKAGVTLPVPLTLAYADTPTVRNAFTALQRAFEKDGMFKITPQPIPRKEYYATVGKPDTQPELVYVGWGMDWPSGATVIPPLFSGRYIIPAGNQNYSLLDDPTINAGIDKALAEPDFDKAQQMWGQLDEDVAKLAATVPLRYDRAVYLRGSKVHGFYVHPLFGEPDVVSMGVG